MTLRAISLGAGVQSSTLLLMVREGELEAECAVFADTGWEPAAVYHHLDWLDSVSTIPIYRVSRGNIRRDALGDGRFVSMPIYTLGETGDEGIGRRQCTREYKVDPIGAKLRELLGAAPRCRIPPGAAESLIGLSLDEVARMKPSRNAWVVNRWPLIERRMTRQDCVLWLQRRGYPIPPKSSCVGCPYHDNSYWRDMRDRRPEEWEDACGFDEALRSRVGRYGSSFRGLSFLHRDRIPLRAVDLSTVEDAGQLDLFQAECEGMCGI